MAVEKQNVPKEYTRNGNTDHRGAKHPIPESRHFSYGTAGFRADASSLPFIMYRVGYLAGLRARFLNRTIGIMITASHNPETDNGVKLIDPKGEMLETSWEKAAGEIVNCSDDEFPTVYRALESEFPAAETDHARVVCGFDTRDSSQYLQNAVVCGVQLAAAKFHSFGLLTTPQLHYIVRCENDVGYGTPTEEGYYNRFANAFNAMLEVTKSGTNYSPELCVDCANGVGATKLRRLVNHLKRGSLYVKFVNEDGPLNYECGADFVKVEQKLPAGFENDVANTRCASLDGDADRVIYFYRDELHKFVLLDGDKIAILIAKYIHEQLVGAKLANLLSMGIVQTAYANGSSTEYIRKTMGMEVRFVPTGVKNLHHEAMKFDIGVYFEANGHGTVTFSEKFHSVISKDGADAPTEVKRLVCLSKLINEVVGDAMADLLVVEMLLRHYDWSVQDWAKNLYSDAASCQIKVKVPDRSLFKTTYDETICLEPEGLQAAIDAIVSEKNALRSFVRPSGTEDIVRVYAEGIDVQNAREVAEKVADAVREFSMGS